MFLPAFSCPSPRSIAFSINRFFLGLLAQLDKSLEEKGVLPKLDEKQFESVKLSSETLKIREMLGDLKLSNDAVLHREEERRKVRGAACRRSYMYIHVYTCI